ncbi:MAG: prenyltransferase [Thiotrichales bacterium]|jgi:1,4-dihydroxy-2-naphthoate octaprenyltransferase|nr:prenyltransferase [Thiotrichales bacterium]
MALSLAQKTVVLFRAARPPFLLLVPIMIVLAAAQVHAEGQHLHNVWLVVLSASTAAAASNLLNEFFDFASGLDQQTRATPFSGGSKALVERPMMLTAVKWLGLLLLSVSVWSGFALVAQVGWPLLLLGLLGVALVVAYTPIINRIPLLCLWAPGVGYGFVIFLGAYWSMGGSLDGQGIMLAPMLILLVSALLLLNQFPDADADALVGRRHAVIAWGRRRAWQLFVSLHLLSYGWLLFAVMVGGLPYQLLHVLVLLPASLWVSWRSYSFIQQEVNIPVLAVNVAVVLLFPALLALSLFVSNGT